MHKYKLVFLLQFGAFMPLHAQGIKLEKGLVYQSEMPSTLEDLKEYYLSHSLPENSFAYLKNSRAGNSYFTVNRESIIFDVELAPKTPKSLFVDETIVNRWPLTRWKHHYFNPEFIAWNEDVAADLTEDGKYWPELYLNPKLENVGCYSNAPLRFGDVGNDSDDDLVVFFGEEFLVFSLSSERVIFSLQYHLDDWMRKEETTDLYDIGMVGMSEDDVLPQYQSKTSGYAIERLQIIANGYRGHSKVFEGDIDDDGNPDLIVWNKLYESRSTADPISGFKIVSNTWLHYERDLEAQAESEASITGEYLPQDTSEEDIKNWLAENELTWSKGYPSKSECPGEEGELIPEMHDPLLNDPDVLK